MLVAAAVCPHPPLLVPEVGVGLGPEIDELRARCAAAVGGLREASADRLYVVGADLGLPARTFGPWAPGSGAEHVAVDVPEPLPLPLLVGGYLTRGTPRSFVVIDPATGPADCTDLGHELAATASRVALLVMGDGAACHDLKAPGYLDPRSADWDGRVHDAFASGALDTLTELDPTLGDELLCAGRASWQVLAGAARGLQCETVAATFAVPFGVGYHVASWRFREPVGA